jgi:hypothetical protein
MARASKQLVTPVGICSFPHLFEPQADQNGKLMYSVTLLFPKTAMTMLAEMKKAELEVAVAKWGEKRAPNILANAKHPLFRDGDKNLDEETGKPKVGFAGRIYVAAKSRNAPKILDAAKNEIIDPRAIYAGCQIRLAGSVFPYEVEVNKGVTFWFDVVQFCADGTRIDGRRDATELLDEWTDAEVADPLA